MEIAIAGAGITGLSAAISLRRSGHRVTIYERSSLNNEIGAAINVPPNVSRFLVPWGLDPVQSRFVTSKGLFFRSPTTLEELSTTIFDKNVERFGAELYYAHRVDLHEALKKLATTKEGPGIPATIVVKSAVVSYDPNTPSMTLADGTVIPQDLVLAADGIHSIGVNSILGKTNAPQPALQSNCCYRFLLSRDELEADPETRFFTEGLPALGLSIYPDIPGHRRFVTYPCRNHEVYNAALICNNEHIKNSTEDWQASVPKNELLEALAGYHPGILAVANKAKELGRWPLLYRPPITTWHKGNMALAGDAVHPMLPHQGQGGAQGLEDGLVLGLVLHGCNSKTEIPNRLALYEKIRRNRAASIQVMSNFGLDEGVKMELEEFMEGEKVPSSIGDVLQMTYGFDTVGKTKEIMEEFQPGWELPEGFFGRP